MKLLINVKTLPLAAMVAAVSLSGPVLAEQAPVDSTAFFTKSVTLTDNQSHESHSRADSSVTLNKWLDVYKDVDYTGKVKIEGEIVIDAASFAVVNDKQSSTLNYIEAADDNDASIGDGAMSDAAGRVSLNIAAGVANQQDNATALTALTTDLGLMYSADAEVFAYQDSEANNVHTREGDNNANVADNVLQNATGDIGVNIASGFNNQQKNNLALSTVFGGTMAEANISAEQYSDRNFYTLDSVNNTATIGGNALATAAGNIGVNISAGVGNQQANHLALSAVSP